MKTINNVYYAGVEDAARTLDVYLPSGKPEAIFLYMHGGGLDHGSKEKTADSIADYLTQRGIAYVTIDYRMYPDAKYPDFINDGAAAIKWVLDNKDIFSGCSDLYVGGSSAGGYLSMMLCFDKRYLAAVGLDNTSIKGYFHDAGQPTAHFNVLKHSNENPKRVIVDERAPLYFIGMEESYPPMRFIVSDNDMTCRYEQTMLVLATMKHFDYTRFDHVVMNGKHCAYCGRIDEDGQSAFAKMVYDFIAKVKAGGYN